MSFEPSETEPRRALSDRHDIDHHGGDDGDQGPPSLGCIDIHDRPTFVP